jgi:hypothetical protein
MSTPVRDAALILRRVRLARADGGTWAQVAPLLGCTDARSAKHAARALERELKPVAARMQAAKRIAEQAAPQ